MVRGEVVILRHANDAGLGFECGDDALRVLEDFKQRSGKFGLSLRPD